VRFVGHGVRKLTPGLTVLEMFRRFGIPHAALCGGRARCATCRVLVIDGNDRLPPPGANEARLLRRIAAPDRVRLACQIRPRDDLQVQILLASRLTGPTRDPESDNQAGKRGLTVMVADLRAFSALAERQLPQDLMGLLNRFFDEMSQAITAHGGRIDAFYGDGFMAVFGLDASPARAAHAAIGASADIVRAVEALNREFGQALPLPLRIGIGVHTGPAIIGAIENDSLGRREITVGETVMIASQLEAATRRVLADVVVSEETIRISGRRYRGTSALKVTIKGREKPLTAYGFASAPELAVGDDDEEPPVATTDTAASPGSDSPTTALQETRVEEPAMSSAVRESAEEPAAQMVAAEPTSVESQAAITGDDAPQSKAPVRARRARTPKAD